MNDLMEKKKKSYELEEPTPLEKVSPNNWQRIVDSIEISNMININNLKLERNLSHQTKNTLIATHYQKKKMSKTFINLRGNFGQNSHANKF